MSIPEKYLAAFEEQKVYHIYNRTNNKELLFKSDENYFYFLKQYRKYLYPFVQTLSYTLLPNHFHLVIRVNKEDEISKYLLSVNSGSLIKTERLFLEQPDKHFSDLIEAAFHRFFTSYSMAFNKMYSRNGNLFHRPFKRIQVENDLQFCQLMVYVHANAQKHRLVRIFSDYKWSSYHSFVSNGATLLDREYVFSVFGDKEQFIDFHTTQSDYYYNLNNSIED